MDIMTEVRTVGPREARSHNWDWPVEAVEKQYLEY